MNTVKIDPFGEEVYSDKLFAILIEITKPIFILLLLKVMLPFLYIASGIFLFDAIYGGILPVALLSKWIMIFFPYIIFWPLVFIQIITSLIIYFVYMLNIQQAFFAQTLLYQENELEILRKLRSIKKTIRNIGYILSFLKFITKKDDYINMHMYILDRLSFFISYTTNLRSDLQIRLTEQKKILESAKSEVTENIRGTSELNQVSELQRVRLDKQIEQFEALQRVLVKV